jgi:hypothetical protein
MRQWSGLRRSVCLVWLNALGVLPVAIPTLIAYDVVIVSY